MWFCTTCCHSSHQRNKTQLIAIGILLTFMVSLTIFCIAAFVIQGEGKNLDLFRDDHRHTSNTYQYQAFVNSTIHLNSQSHPNHFESNVKKKKKKEGISIELSTTEDKPTSGSSDRHQQLHKNQSQTLSTSGEQSREVGSE